MKGKIGSPTSSIICPPKGVFRHQQNRIRKARRLYFLREKYNLQTQGGLQHELLKLDELLSRSLSDSYRLTLQSRQRTILSLLGRTSSPAVPLTKGVGVKPTEKPNTVDDRGGLVGSVPNAVKQPV